MGRVLIQQGCGHSKGQGLVLPGLQEEPALPEAFLPGAEEVVSPSLSPPQTDGEQKVKIGRSPGEKD